MSGKASQTSFWRRGPFLFGVLLSLVILGFWAYSLLGWPNCSGIGPCKTNLDVLRFDAEPNEIGDMLAGFAGALAFVWIVVTVLLQAIELREQREQFEKMADAQASQVELLIKQGAIFEREQQERLERREQEQFSAHLAWFVRTFEVTKILFRWNFEPTPKYGILANCELVEHSSDEYFCLLAPQLEDSSVPIDDRFGGIVKFFATAFIIFTEGDSASFLVSKPNRSSGETFLDAVNRLNDEIQSKSDLLNLRRSSISIDLLKSHLEDLLSKNIWESDDDTS